MENITTFTGLHVMMSVAQLHTWMINMYQRDIWSIQECLICKTPTKHAANIRVVAWMDELADHWTGGGVCSTSSCVTAAWPRAKLQLTSSIIIPPLAVHLSARVRFSFFFLMFKFNIWLQSSAVKLNRFSFLVFLKKEKNYIDFF